MKNYSLLIGNGINNIGKDNSWDNLITEIAVFCKIKFKIDDEKKAHFPLLYEEIFLTAAQKNKIKEIDLKRFIANKVATIKGNNIHKKIASLNCSNIITTNYEFSLEGIFPKKNNGLINEKIYSIFRHYTIHKKNFWHIHGDSNHAASINLGFEHYGGQLQYIRNYVTKGYEFTNNKKHIPLPLIKLLQQKKITHHSWIDLFFTTDIYIIGLTFDFVETDLWWLLTYRARKKIEYPHLIKNEITYYIPKKFATSAKNKLDLFKATQVKVVVIDKTGESFYNNILNKLN